MNLLKTILLLLVSILLHQSISLSQSNSRFRYPDTSGYSPYVLKMTLPKQTYQEYEPVIAKFELINNDSKVLDIYDLFSVWTTSASVIITDDLGNTWHINHQQEHISISLIYMGPDYSLQKGDTMVTIMNINCWGEDINKAGYKGRISEYGYFPAGRKYKAIFYATSWYGKRSNFNITSNTVSFSVDSVSKCNFGIARMIDSAFGPINNDSAARKWAADFKDCSFTEYLLKPHLNFSNGNHMREDEPNSEAVIENYKFFFSKYPGSYLVYDYDFMNSLYKILFKDRNDSWKVIPAWCNEFGSSIMPVLWNKKFFPEWIKRFFVQHRQKQWIITDIVDYKRKRGY